MTGLRETAKPEFGWNVTLALCLILVGTALRLLPHPANFAPIAAIAIFGGAVLPRQLAVAVPLAAVVLSDLFIGFYRYKIMFVVWGCYALTAFVSSRWLRKPGLAQGAILTVSGSLLFFTATNFAVWLWGNMYTLNWDGLVRCYTMALPFFRNTLVSDLFYTSALFGAYAATRRAVAWALGSTVEAG